MHPVTPIERITHAVIRFRNRVRFCEWCGQKPVAAKGDRFCSDACSDDYWERSAV
jgi:hypothetical protein